MSQKISKATVHAASHRAAPHAAAKHKAKAAPRFGDEMSTGKGSALRASARKAVSSPLIGADYLSAFDKKIAQLMRDVAAGKPGAKEELAAVIEDRQSLQTAVADAEKQVAANDDPTMAAELRKKLADVKEFGVKVAGMNPTERQNLRNFFRLAKEDPAAFKRFVDGVQAQGAPAAQPTTSAQPTAPVQPTAPTGAPANIQAAIDFGLSQLGAPYVGGGSPFRFGTPGDGKTYQLPGQKPYVSQKGVIGYDCSGLMVTMLKKAGIDISKLGSSRAMKAALPEVDKNQLQPGDLLVKDGHVAMYIGDGKMIESVPGGVKVSPASKYINDPAYSGHRPG
jgi:cell wall-associated NlpC family hydrolase